MKATEKDIERRFRTLGSRAGALVLKLTSPGNAGVPDRIVLRDSGIAELVELKAPGMRPRPLQARTFGRLASMGQPVTVIDSTEAAESFWEARS